jgi:hypothetical protein
MGPENGQLDHLGVRGGGGKRPEGVETYLFFSCDLYSGDSYPKMCVRTA